MMENHLFAAWKYQLTSVAIIVSVIVLAVLGTLALYSVEDEAINRYQQHLSEQRVSSLSSEDQEAVSSLAVDAASFATHLPIVSITVDGQKVPGERKVTLNEAGEVVEESYTLAEDGGRTIASTFQVFYKEGANRLSDAPVVETQAELRYRGHSSRLFDKKSYAAQFTLPDRVTENKVNVLDMGSDDEWDLYGPFLDKTLIRNYMSLNLAGQIGEAASEVRYCELFLDGEYQGLYVLMQPASKAVSRDQVYSLGSNAKETGYVVKRDWTDESDSSTFRDFLEVTDQAANTTSLTTEYPSSAMLTAGQKAYIESGLNRIEKTLYSYDYDSLTYGYGTFLNVGSFVDYFIINEFACNEDAGTYSTFYYKPVSGKLSIGPVWDFNNAYGNNIEAASDTSGFIMVAKPFYFMLCKDEKFIERVIDRYRELRKSVLSDAYLEAYVDDVVDYLGPAIQRNYEVWGYSFDPTMVDVGNKLSPDDRNPSCYQDAVSDLKSFICGRGAWLDEYIENLKQYCHESAVKKYN